MEKHKPYGVYERFLKRPLDILCALLALIVFCWLYAIVALLVRVKLGSPVLFKQERPGKNEKIFRLYKFRTMTDEERALSLDHIVGHFYDDADNEKCRQAAAGLQPFVEDVHEEDTPESQEHFYSEFFDYLVSQLTADLHYYWNYYDLFTLKERNLIEPLFDHPLAVDLVNQIWEEYKAALDKEPFALPDDFFDWQHKSNTPKEYFYMDDVLKKKGVDTFVAFIDWLAEKGYIADDNEVKALFAYRLTGRCRPEREELPMIEWHGKNGKSYELIYLVRFLSDRGDYRKMRRFFIGPEWVKDRDSSYANSADSEFRIKMSEFYPEACEFKK